MSKPLSKQEYQELQQAFARLTPEQQAQLNLDNARLAKTQQKQSEKSKYLSEDGIVDFVRTELGVKPTDYQENALRAIVKHKQVAIRAPHSVGKTTIAAWFILWVMHCYETDVKIPTTASSWLQLERYTMPEVRKWAKRMKKRDFRILKHSLSGDDKEMFVFSPEDPARAEGAHAKVLAVVFDEAKAIPTPLFDAMEGAMMSADNDEGAIVYALMLSTPGNPQGRFYDVHTRAKGLENWHTIHISLEDAVKAGRISQSRVDKLADLWGTESAIYKNRVLGEFDQSGDEVVIPLHWIELAIERAKELTPGEGPGVFGVDPARFGSDKTAIANLRGRVIMPLTYLSGKDNMQVAGRVASMTTKETPIAIDVIGMPGVTDRLTELGYRAKGVNVSEAAKDAYNRPLKDMYGEIEFFNLRSWLWWHVRDMLNPANPDAIGLPDDDRLAGDLSAPKYDYKSNGRLYVESKEDTKKRLKRSTDGADAVALALYIADEQNRPRKPVIFEFMDDGTVMSSDPAQDTTRKDVPDWWYAPGAWTRIYGDD